ncbi:MAG: hypothetical protein ABIK89_19485 [Planctomycetota bacterium]
MPHDFSHNYATRYRRDYGGETAPAARRVLGAWKTGHKTLRTLVMLAKACGFRLVASLTRERDRNIRLLFEKTNERALQIARRSYSETMAAVNRYNLVTYHLRPSYWQDRAETLIQHVSERLWTERRLKRILDTRDQLAASGPKVLPSSGLLAGDEAGGPPLSKAG